MLWACCSRSPLLPSCCACCANAPPAPRACAWRLSAGLSPLRRSSRSLPRTAFWAPRWPPSLRWASGASRAPWTTCSPRRHPQVRAQRVTRAVADASARRPVCSAERDGHAALHRHGPVLPGHGAVWRQRGGAHGAGAADAVAGRRWGPGESTAAAAAAVICRVKGAACAVLGMEATFDAHMWSAVVRTSTVPFWGLCSP